MNELEDELLEELEKSDLLETTGLEKLHIFVDVFRRWNEKINLMSRKGIQHLVERHIKDGLPLAKNLGKEARCIDVGSGGGLPGIVVASLRPDCEVHLVEPLRKRVLFLRETKKTARLDNITILGKRIEELEVHGSYTESFSRATFDSIKWLEIGEGLFNRGGRI